MSICIIDAGGQYTKVIDRRIRELKVKSDIIHSTLAADLDKIKQYSGISLITLYDSSIIIDESSMMTHN